MPTFTDISKKVPCVFKLIRVRCYIFDDQKGNENSNQYRRDIEGPGSQDPNSQLLKMIPEHPFPKGLFGLSLQPESLTPFPPLR